MKKCILSQYYSFTLYYFWAIFNSLNAGYFSIPFRCQTVWSQIRLDIVCKDYQHRTLAGKELNIIATTRDFSTYHIVKQQGFRPESSLLTSTNYACSRWSFRAKLRPLALLQQLLPPFAHMFCLLKRNCMSWFNIYIFEASLQWTFRFLQLFIASWMTQIWLTAAKLTCPCNTLRALNSFTRSDTGVVIDSEPHPSRRCKTCLMFAPLAVRFHAGCSAFPFYTPTKPFIW